MQQLRWTSPIYPICDGTNEIVTAQFEIKYTGKRAGAEAARLFRSQEKPATDAVRKKVESFFAAWRKKTISIPLARSALANYNSAQNSWVAHPVNFEILIVSSSRDIRLRANFNLAVN